MQLLPSPLVIGWTDETLVLAGIADSVAFSSPDLIPSLATAPANRALADHPPLQQGLHFSTVTTHWQAEHGRLELHSLSLRPSGLLSLA